MSLCSNPLHGLEQHCDVTHDPHRCVAINGNQACYCCQIHCQERCNYVRRPVQYVCTRIETPCEREKRIQRQLAEIRHRRAIILSLYPC